MSRLAAALVSKWRQQCCSGEEGQFAALDGYDAEAAAAAPEGDAAGAAVQGARRDGCRGAGMPATVPLQGRWPLKAGMFQHTHTTAALSPASTHADFKLQAPLPPPPPPPEAPPQPTRVQPERKDRSQRYKVGGRLAASGAGSAAAEAGTRTRSKAALSPPTSSRTPVAPTAPAPAPHPCLQEEQAYLEGDSEGEDPISSSSSEDEEEADDWQPPGARRKSGASAGGKSGGRARGGSPQRPVLSPGSDPKQKKLCFAPRPPPPQVQAQLQAPAQQQAQALA